MNISHSTFVKAAVFEQLMKGVKTIGSQLLEGGMRAGRPGVVGPGAAVGGMSVAGKPLINRGAGLVRKRMINRSIAGAAVGAGGSMIQQKLRGEDVSIGRAAVGGALGAGVGAAAGTTVGARGLRRLTAAKTTPHMTFGQAANPAGWFKAAPNVVSGGPVKRTMNPATWLKRPTAPQQIVSRGRTAFGNLSPVDKAFVGMNAVDAAKSMTDKEHEGRRGEAVGGLAGMSAAMMTGSRWGGMRRAAGGGGTGPLARSLGLYMGGDFAGRRVGKIFDKKKENLGAA